MKRDNLSKFDYGEGQFRGGYQLGFEAAIANVKAVLELADRHVSELEAWAVGDPKDEADPPALALETAGNG